MPLPLTVSCFSKIQIGFTFLVPAHPGSPGQRAVKRVCVCVDNNDDIIMIHILFAEAEADLTGVNFVYIALVLDVTSLVRDVRATTEKQVVASQHRRTILHQPWYLCMPYHTF